MKQSRLYQIIREEIHNFLGEEITDSGLEDFEDAFRRTIDSDKSIRASILFTDEINKRLSQNLRIEVESYLDELAEMDERKRRIITKVRNQIR